MLESISRGVTDRKMMKKRKPTTLFIMDFVVLRASQLQANPYYPFRIIMSRLNCNVVHSEKKEISYFSHYLQMTKSILLGQVSFIAETIFNCDTS